MNSAAQKLAQPNEPQEPKDAAQIQTHTEIKNETDKRDSDSIKTPKSTSPSSPKSIEISIPKPSLKSQLWPSKKLASKIPAPKEASSPIPTENENVRRLTQQRPSGQSDAMMSEIGPPSQSEDSMNDRKFSMNSDIFFESLYKL